MKITFNINDISNLALALQEARSNGVKEISYLDLLKFSYDKTHANTLIYSANSFKEYVVKVEQRDGIYYAILKT